MEMEVYIANVGKLNEGELVGEWFRPPIDFEDVAEKIGLNSQYKEYAIPRYELPFEVSQDTSIEEVNRLCGLVRELEGTPSYDALSELLASGYFNGIEDLAQRQESVLHWVGCEDMADVARQCVEENGLWNVPERLWNYLNYNAIGQTLETGGIFISTRHGIFEVCR